MIQRGGACKAQGWCLVRGSCLMGSIIVSLSHIIANLQQ